MTRGKSQPVTSPAIPGRRRALEQPVTQPFTVTGCSVVQKPHPPSDSGRTPNSAVGTTSPTGPAPAGGRRYRQLGAGRSAVGVVNCRVEGQHLLHPAQRPASVTMLVHCRMISPVTELPEQDFTAQKVRANGGFASGPNDRVVCAGPDSSHNQLGKSALPLGGHAVYDDDKAGTVFRSDQRIRHHMILEAVPAPRSNAERASGRQRDITSLCRTRGGYLPRSQSRHPGTDGNTRCQSPTRRSRETEQA